MRHNFCLNFGGACLFCVPVIPTRRVFWTNRKFAKSGVIDVQAFVARASRHGVAWRGACSLQHIYSKPTPDLEAFSRLYNLITPHPKLRPLSPAPSSRPQKTYFDDFSISFPHRLPATMMLSSFLSCSVAVSLLSACNGFVPAGLTGLSVRARAQSPSQVRPTCKVVIIGVCGPGRGLVAKLGSLGC